MKRLLVSRGQSLLSLVLIATATLGCAEKESPTELGPRNLSVPASYASPQLAAAAASAGDKIIVSYRDQPYIGDLVLPAGVSLVGHNANPLLPRLRGQVSLIGGDATVKIADLRIENPDGGGLRLEDSACRVEGLWIHDCDGPGIELVGDAPASVSGCDIQGCLPGILIRDTTLGGHYGDSEHPAASISDCNFLENGPLGDLDNLVFSNIPISYTVYVKWNYWGAEGLDVTAIDATIFDNKDDPAIHGFAFTEAEDEDDTFAWWPDPVVHWWQE